MLLLLPEDLADVLGDRVLAERLAFPHAHAVIPHRLVLVIEIGAQHGLVLLDELHRLRRRGGHPSEVVDVLRDGQRVLQFLCGVGFQFLGNVHVLGAFEGL